MSAAEVVLPCAELQATLAFFTDVLGFRVDAIHPADDPKVAVISGFGLRIRLERGAGGSPGVLRLSCRDPGASTELTAPNGTRIQIVAFDPPLVLPPSRPSFVLSRMTDGAAWVEGRAGMRYRDLIPDRQGGRFIASHIQIPEGGPVADYVHFHKVRFQMIYCVHGWVRLVYEDQGPPFVLNAGDCVLQPPQIRHRVLESSPGLEVIEIGSPAEHETFADHDLPLPTPVVRESRDFGGQRFVRHEAARASWQVVGGVAAGFEHRDLGIAQATDGLAGARVVRARGGKELLASSLHAERTETSHSLRSVSHDGELLFMFVLKGAATLTCDGAKTLAAKDAFVVPAGMQYQLTQCSDDLELLEVTLPGSGGPREAS